MKIIHFFLPHPIVTYPVRKMQQMVDTLLQKEHFSGAICFTSIMGSYMNGKTIPKVLDVDAGLTSFALERYRLENTRIKKWRAWVSLQKSINFEQGMVCQFDAAIVLTKGGLAAQRQIFTKAKRIAVIGNGVDLNYYHFNNEEPEPYSLVYNGSLTFSANYDAIKWFLHDIFPIIKIKLPLIKLRITGKYESVDIKSLSINGGVTLTGYIPDVRPVVAKSWICIVPIRIGGGQRMKVLEAMALGTPVVSTSRGIEGLDLIAGEHVLVADEPEDFAEAIILLLQDNRLRSTVANNARILIEKIFNWDSILLQYNSLIGSTFKN
jgi:glycosyltransferase involved in cell wall biosynthesis